MKTRAKHPLIQRPKTSTPLPHQSRPSKTPNNPPRQHAHKTPPKTPNPQHTPGENNKSIQTHQNPGIRRSFQKTVKTGPHQVKHYPVCQKQYPIITHENHNQRSCYTAVFCATPTRVQSRGQSSQPQPQRLSPTCFKSYGGSPSSSQKRTRYQQSNTHKDLQPSSISDTPTKSSPPESSRTTISQVINT